MNERDRGIGIEGEGGKTSSLSKPSIQNWYHHNKCQLHNYVFSFVCCKPTFSTVSHTIQWLYAHSQRPFSSLWKLTRHTNAKLSSSPLFKDSSFGSRYDVAISHRVHALDASSYEMLSDKENNQVKWSFLDLYKLNFYMIVYNKCFTLCQTVCVTSCYRIMQ